MELNLKKFYFLFSLAVFMYLSYLKVQDIEFYLSCVLGLLFLKEHKAINIVVYITLTSVIYFYREKVFFDLNALTLIALSFYYLFIENPKNSIRYLKLGLTLAFSLTLVATDKLSYEQNNLLKNIFVIFTILNVETNKVGPLLYLLVLSALKSLNLESAYLLASLSVVLVVFYKKKSEFLLRCITLLLLIFVLDQKDISKSHIELFYALAGFVIVGWKTNKNIFMTGVMFLLAFVSQKIPVEASIVFVLAILLFQSLEHKMSTSYE